MAPHNRFWRRACADWAPHHRAYLLRGLFGGPVGVAVGLWVSSGYSMNPTRVAIIAGLIGAVCGPIVVSAATFLWCLVRAPFRLLSEREEELRILREGEERRRSLGPDASELLSKAAMREQDIRCTDIYVSAGPENFATVNDLKSFARWKAAVQELYAKGLIERIGTEGCFGITHAGYQRADELRKSPNPTT